MIVSILAADVVHGSMAVDVAFADGSTAAHVYAYPNADGDIEDSDIACAIMKCAVVISKRRNPMFVMNGEDNEQ